MANPTEGSGWHNNNVVEAEMTLTARSVQFESIQYLLLRKLAIQTWPRLPGPNQGDKFGGPFSSASRDFPSRPLFLETRFSGVRYLAHAFQRLRCLAAFFTLLTCFASKRWTTRRNI